MFPNFLLLLISNWIPLWSENILWMISIFFNLVKLILCQHIVRGRIFCGHLRRMCILLLLGKVLCRCLLDLGALYCCSVFSFLVSLLPGCSAHYWRWKIEVSNYYWSITYFTLEVCQFALYVFFGSVVKCIFVVYNYDVFLEDWSFYHYKMDFTSSNTFFFISKSTFSDISKITPALFL